MLKGSTMSEEQKRKISKSLRGHKHKEISKKRMSEGMREYWRRRKLESGVSS